MILLRELRAELLGNLPKDERVALILARAHKRAFSRDAAADVKHNMSIA